jgi:hypothetical protein
VPKPSAPKNSPAKPSAAKSSPARPSAASPSAPETTAATDAAAEAEPAPAPTPPQTGGISKKAWLWIGGVVIAMWAFALNTGSTIMISIVGGLTLVIAGLLVWAMRLIRKQRSTVSLLQGATASPEARREALAKLSEGKDASSPTNVFARAQLMAPEDPQGALKLLGSIELKNYHPSMQDDVSLLQTQLYLGLGRTADARKTADVMNLDNPQRKEIRPLTGKPKEALALLENLELPKKDGEQIALQAKVARIFARFAANQRAQARVELNALADDDPNHLGRFMMPQFRVHPELQKLARQVLEQHPAARKHMKAQARRR